MKRIITLFMFLFVVWQANSQGLNTELGFNYEYSQFTLGIACDGVYSYLAISEGETGSVDFAGINRNTRLVKIDTLGNIVWEVFLTPGSPKCIHSLKLVPAGDGGIYLFGYSENHCAHPFDGFVSFLQKRDPAGNVVWTHDWTINDFYPAPFTGFTVGTSGNLLLNHTSSTGSWVYTISPSGVTTDSILISEPYIEGFAGHSAFAVTGYRNDSLMAFNTSGMPSHTTVFSSPVKGIHSINDTLFVLTQDSIFSFNGYLQPIHGYSIPGLSSYSTLKVDGENIRFLSHGTSSLTVITLNRQLQVTGTLTIPEAIGQEAFVDFNDLHLSAGITFNLTDFTAVRFLNYSMNSAQNVTLNRTDIGVINLISTLVTASPYGQTGSVYNTRLEADVLIKNYGPNTLQSCRITRYNGLSVMVNPTVYAQEFHNLNLAPGDSVWISLGAIHQGLASTAGNEISRNICIHTNHPNGLVDLNVSNDEFCTGIIFGYVGIEETKTEKALSIFPNPASSILNFEMKESTETIHTIELFDIHGRLVAVSHPHSHTAAMDIRHLSNGIYLARVTTSDGLLIRKLVRGLGD